MEKIYLTGYDKVKEEKIGRKYREKETQMMNNYKDLFTAYEKLLHDISDTKGSATSAFPTESMKENLLMNTL